MTSNRSAPAASPDGADDDRHRLSMTILMTPDLSNFAGNVHGGQLLKYLDQVAYTCATRWARTYAVTLSVDRVVFREPIHVGELVTFQASVNRTGRTSMEIGVRVTTQDLVSQIVRHTNSCYFTMVAIGPDGRPPRDSSVAPWDCRGTPPVQGRGPTSRPAPRDRAGERGDPRGQGSLTHFGRRRLRPPCRRKAA